MYVLVPIAISKSTDKFLKVLSSDLIILRKVLGRDARGMMSGKNVCAQTRQPESQQSVGPGSISTFEAHNSEVVAGSVIDISQCLATLEYGFDHAESDRRIAATTSSTTSSNSNFN